MASGHVLLSAALVVAAMISPASAQGLADAPLLRVSLSGPAETREGSFAYRVVTPERPDGRVIVLMHGSGGDESTLVALASRIAPDATLIGVRGRVVQEGVKRWYRRVSPTEFDQEDVRAEASAFVEFIRGTAAAMDLDLSTVTFLGYSNGANLIAALTQLHPGLVRRAVLLRPMPVLTDAPEVDLSDTSILTIAGQNDLLYFPYAERLEALFRNCGARVDARTILSGHDLGEDDVRLAAEWLGSVAK